MKKLVLGVVLALSVSNAFALSCIVKTGKGYQCTQAGNSGKCPGANFQSEKQCSELGGSVITEAAFAVYFEKLVISRSM